MRVGGHEGLSHDGNSCGLETVRTEELEERMEPSPSSVKRLLEYCNTIEKSDEQRVLRAGCHLLLSTAPRALLVVSPLVRAMNKKKHQIAIKIFKACEACRFLKFSFFVFSSRFNDS